MFSNKEMVMASTLKELEEAVYFISMALAREQASIKLYTEACDKAISETVKKVFSSLLEQERLQEEALRAQLEELKAEIEQKRQKGETSKD
jgi:rubrerythrin